jgi:hypothetical protein
MALQPLAKLLKLRFKPLYLSHVPPSSTRFKCYTKCQIGYEEKPTLPKIHMLTRKQKKTILNGMRMYEENMGVEQMFQTFEGMYMLEPKNLSDDKKFKQVSKTVREMYMDKAEIALENVQVETKYYQMFKIFQDRDNFWDWTDLDWAVYCTVVYLISQEPEDKTISKQLLAKMKKDVSKNMKEVLKRAMYN